MDKAFMELRRVSIIAYAFLFGSIFGYNTFGYTVDTFNPHGVTKDTGLLYVWFLMLFVGLIFGSIKDGKITNTKLRVKIIIADFLVTLILIVLSMILPAFLGLVKGLIVLILMIIYIIIYVKILYKGKLLEDDGS